MCTEKQRLANRRNAQHSTGPTSPEGKARSARNALQHGLTAQTPVLLPSEDPDQFHAFHEQMLHRSCSPAPPCSGSWPSAS